MAANNEAALRQCAVNLRGGGAQQSITTKVIFLLNVIGLVKLVTFNAFLYKIAVRNPGNT